MADAQKKWSESITETLRPWIPEALKSIAVSVRNNLPIDSTMDLVSQLPASMQTKLQNLCNNDGQQCVNWISNQAGLASIVGISLVTFLYIKLKGTQAQKKELEKKLRNARRQSEESSEEVNRRSLHRRKTNKLRQISRLNYDDSSSSMSSSSMSSSSMSSNSRRRQLRRSMRSR